MKRRHFTKTLGAGVLAGAALPYTLGEAKSEITWKMVTTWPKNFPGIGVGVENLAKRVDELSGGRMTIKVYGAGEVVPALEVFDAVSRGTAEMGHAGAYYWKGKNEAFQFFSSVPFGMNAMEMNAWLYYGGGLKLWQEGYEKFNLIPMPGGNTGVQMGGWFNKQINSVDDLKGLKMRMPGLGGEVLKRAGGTPVTLPGGELFNALKNGTIDATEWVGPYNDLAFGLHKAAKYYYYPGWHEPGTPLEITINKKAFDALPADLQSIVLNACKILNQDMLNDLTANNNQALHALKTKHHVDVRRFPDVVLKKLKVISDEVVADLAAKDAYSKMVFDSYRNFRDVVLPWHAISEYAYLRARQL
ncbi:MAG: TRAP transporter substrate-binding protein [Gammaproteobacteria bacterium]|nr:TRAP transporter substrate-binding protein [Gammaproteobacteria bacterium]